MNKVIALMLSAGLTVPAFAERDIYGWEFLSAEVRRQLDAHFP